MTYKKIKIRETSTFEAVLSKNPWMQKLPENDLSRCQKEIEDIIHHGQLLAKQGASFSTRRDINLNEMKITVSASYGKSSILQKIFPWIFS